MANGPGSTKQDEEPGAIAKGDLQYQGPYPNITQDMDHIVQTMARMNISCMITMSTAPVAFTPHKW